MADIRSTGLFYHEITPATVRVAQTLGLTASAFLCGNVFAESYTLTPAIMKAPAPLLAQQFKKAYDQGKLVVFPLSVISGALFGWLAYRERASVSATRLYAAAAVLVPSILPYSALVMMPTINKLHEKENSMAATSITDSAAEAGVAKEETVHALVDKFATMNLARFLLASIGAICATWATVNRIEVVGSQHLGFSTGANRLG